MLICCVECAAYPCAIKCRYGALSFFSGLLNIETEKCAPCSKYKRGVLPDCVDMCNKSTRKTPVEIIGIEKKRLNAAEVI